MKKFRKKLIRYGLPILVLIIALGGAYSYFGRQKKPVYTTAKVTKGTIIQTVSETGNVKHADQLDLQFLSSGKIAKLNTAVGKNVKRGDVLAELDLADANIKLKQATAQLSGANANLNKLLNGATQEDIKITEESVNQAEAGYKSAKDSLNRIKATTDLSIQQAQKSLNDLEAKESGGTLQYEAITTSQTLLDNLKSTLGQTVDNQRTNTLSVAEDKLSVGYAALDQINRILTDQNADDTLSVRNSSYLQKTQSEYTDAISLWNIGKASLQNAKLLNNDNNINKATLDCLAFLSKTLSALNNCFKVLENTVTSSSFSQTSLDAYKTGINAQITTINLSISSMQSSQQALNSSILNYHTKISEAENSLSQAQASYNTALISAGNALDSSKKSRDQQITSATSQVNAAKEALDTAKAQLAKIKAPSNSSDIALAGSQIVQAQAGVLTVKKMVDDATIKAPLDGFIIKVNNDIGEISGPQTPLISMLGKDKLEINVDISETDIDKVTLGDQTTITYDAFGEDKVINGEVYFIDPAQTIIQDVVFYRIKVRMFEPDQQKNESVKSVMEKIKPGMTANVIIETNRRDNVIIVPMRAITDKGAEGQFVKILKNEQVTESKIVTGLRGDDGEIEVISGVSEGDEVVTFIK